MKETVNFGFKKPESTDFVDVSVFGENFDKIDAELARKTIPIVLNQEIDLTQDNGGINVTEQIAAVADRFVSDLKRGTPVSVTFTNENTPVTVLLKDWFEINATSYVVSGIFPNPRDTTILSRFDLFAYLGAGSDLQYTAKVGGSGSEQLATSAHVVKADGKVTITERMEDGTDSVTVIEYDENEVPTKITTNGHVLPITWEGF